jgi:hypothetical protein
VTLARRIALTLVLLGGAGTLTGLATLAVFSSTAQSAGNSFAAGTVAISDNDAGSALLALAAAAPGDSDTGCIQVTYTGTLASSVRLYGAVSGSLAPYLTLTVTRGADSSPSFDSCAAFTPDATNYLGQGAGVVYSGSLAAFPSTYAAGIVDPTSGSPESWTQGEAHSYRFTVTLQNDTAAQGLSATAGFTWEARNQ